MIHRATACAGTLLLAALAGSTGHASPNVSLDEPIYEQLAALRARGRLPAYLGGLRPLTEARARRLLMFADAPGLELLTLADGWWFAPLRRAVGRVGFFSEEARPYSTAVRPRDVAGAVAMSCEHEEGRPCGDGLGLMSELDSSAGYGAWVSASIRLRAVTGTESYDSDVDVDRAYVNAELGPVALEAGRDVIVLGPSSRTQLGWGDNAPPLDHVRISTARPIDLIGRSGSALRANLVYLVGRLRAPQTFPGNLVSISRGQLDLADSVEVGMMQLLQTAGDGAPSVDVWDFLLEHVRRRDASAGPTDSSNRRFGLDVAVRIDRLLGARPYYQLMFEDARLAEFDDALRHDADHLVGLELASLGACRHGLVVEWHKTGVRSHEHSPRTTGFTSAGRIVGSPLGPDAQSLFGGARLELGWSSILPWIEIARLSSDSYTFTVDGPIERAAKGVAEYRTRGGARWRWPVEPFVRLELEVTLEHVAAAGFEPGARENNLGIAGTVVWQPGGAGLLAW
jgi:hypothetical protein